MNIGAADTCRWDALLRLLILVFPGLRAPPGKISITQLEEDYLRLIWNENLFCASNFDFTGVYLEVYFSCLGRQS